MSLAVRDQERRYSVLKMKSSQINAKQAKERRSTRGRAPGHKPTGNSVELLWKTMTVPAAATMPETAETPHTIVRRIFIVCAGSHLAMRWRHSIAGTGQRQAHGRGRGGW